MVVLVGKHVSLYLQFFSTQSEKVMQNEYTREHFHGYVYITINKLKSPTPVKLVLSPVTLFMGQMLNRPTQNNTGLNLF